MSICVSTPRLDPAFKIRMIETHTLTADLLAADPFPVFEHPVFRVAEKLGRLLDSQKPARPVAYPRAQLRTDNLRHEPAQLLDAELHQHPRVSFAKFLRLAHSSLLVASAPSATP